MKPNIENLKALVYKRDVTKYQAALGMREFERLLDYINEIEQLNIHGIVRPASDLRDGGEPLGNEAVAKSVCGGHDPEVVKRMWQDESKYGNRAFE
jgi:shikimate kinase